MTALLWGLIGVTVGWFLTRVVWDEIKEYRRDRQFDRELEDLLQSKGYKRAENVLPSFPAQRKSHWFSKRR